MLPKDVERFEAYRDHGVRDWVRNTLRGLTDRAAAGLTGIVLAKKKLEYDSISPCSQTNTPPSILLEPPFQPRHPDTLPASLVILEPLPLAQIHILKRRPALTHHNKPIPRMKHHRLHPGQEARVRQVPFCAVRLRPESPEARAVRSCPFFRPYGCIWVCTFQSNALRGIKTSKMREKRT